MTDIREFMITNPTPGQYTDKGRLYSADVLRDMVEEAQEKITTKCMFVYAPTTDPIPGLDKVTGFVRSLKFDDYLYVSVESIGGPNEVFLSICPCIYPVMNGTIGENGVIIKASLDWFEMDTVRPQLPHVPKPEPEEPKGRVLRP